MDSKKIKNKFPKKIRDKYRYSYKKSIQEIKTIIGKIQRQFSRPPFPKQEGVINLNLGCGNINHTKFINIDLLNAPHIHYIREIGNLRCFHDQSVDLIYASHCLEHFPHSKVPKILNEWFRVLKDDGILRISVPDFDLLLKIYEANDNNINTIKLMLMGEQNYQYNFHFTVFNRKSLESLLHNSGFKIVKEWQPGTDELTTFNDTSILKLKIKGKDYPISLNLEAAK
ncbi:MAG: methyltransferase domain-containing protein [Okeania sp. SIO2F4]|uniref:class I SAM-dependent methyltransferase n=1 Tax=Okeania sp. SIO2F4 TaxID=2607790 RepID=UPI00142BE52D|nr:methyltransferase domain-containing protein [Okeania sp. SIO2F4]NES05176.1 methyltransferase domain-containing protein [Okeania sp. SIO2F4]